MNKQAFVPTCPCTARAMRAAQAARDSWNAQITRRETDELIAALERHGYVSPAAEQRMKALRALHA